MYKNPEYMKEWRVKNKEKIRQQTSIYRKKIKEKYQGKCKCGCGQDVDGYNFKKKSPVLFAVGHYKSRKNKFRQAGASKAWKSTNGYMLINVYDGKGHKKCMTEHRYLISKMLGRDLKKDEHIDHINGNKTDNRLENLRVCTKIQNEYFYYGITDNDKKIIIEKIKSGISFNASIKGTNVKCPKTAKRIFEKAYAI